MTVYNPDFANVQKGDYLNTVRIVNKDGSSNIPKGQGIFKVDNRPYLRGSRPSFRKDFEQNLYDYYNGIVQDSNTKEILDWKPGQPRKGIVDFGHTPGEKYSNVFEKYKNELRTPKQFRDWYNDVSNYQFENPSNNRSHKYEQRKEDKNMYENITLDSIAHMGTYEKFVKMYKEGEQYKKDITGDTLLWTALCNTNNEEKYKIANFLINKGADVKFINKEGLSLFFPLFSHGRDDIVKTTILCKTLLEKGADITLLYKPYNTVMFKNIFNYDNVPEIEMMPLYELIFAQPGLKLLVKDKWGLTLLDFAKKAGRYIGVKYIEDYIKKYNLTNEQF